MIATEVNGFSGGIWVFWQGQMDMEVLSVHDQIVNMAIKKGGSVLWIFSAIYASSKVSFRHLLWNYLEHLGSCFDSLGFL